MAKTVSIQDFDEAVRVFKAAWEAADSAGLAGRRTQSGIQALFNAGWRAPKKDSLSDRWEREPDSETGWS